MRFLFPGTKKIITIDQPNGAAGAYYITFQKKHHGQIVKTSKGWKAYLNKDSELLPFLDRLVKAVEKEESKKAP